jgi:putative ABC transport system permease protein
MTHSIRNFWRDLRVGDLNMLIAAVTLAVAALCAVSLFADRLNGAFNRDAQQLLGGDAVVVSDQSTPEAVINLAKKNGLQAASTLTFPTMARSAQGTKLVALKAAENGYPLRGNLKIANENAIGVVTKQLPAKAEVWVENSLLVALDAKLGDELMLGDSKFKIAQILLSEPDRGMGFLNFAPRVLMRFDDLPGTGLVQPASRITYRFAVIGTQIAKFSESVNALLPNFKGVRLDSLEGGRPETRQILGTTEKFLNLVALLCALVCAAAVAISARDFAAKRIDDCALRRVLGQSQREIAFGFAFEFLLVGLIASLLGCVLGYALHQVFISVLAQLMDTTLPMPSVWPLIFGIGVGLTLLLGFGLPPVLQLAGTPPLRVLRRDVGEMKATSLFTLLVGVFGFVALLLVASKDWLLGLMTTGGFAAALLVFAGLAWLTLEILKRLQAKDLLRSQILRLATRQVLAHKAQTVVQVAALSIGLLALFLLILLRSDLLANWQKAKPANTPNRMVINVQPDQAINFNAALQAASIKGYDWYPMFRGRLIAVNDAPVSADQFEDDRAKRLVEREFNLSHTAQLPSHNQLAEGAWLAEEEGAISVEEGIAKTLRLKLGDQLRFDVAGQISEARITSLRKVDWQSMRANFFVLYPKAVMPDVSITYMAAFKMAADPQAAPDIASKAFAFDNQLVRSFPNITLIDLTQSLVEFQNVLIKVTRAVESLFAFTLAAGLLVLLATLYATGRHTQRDFALMRALGASSVQVRSVQALQLAGVGALSGLLAAMVAQGLAFALAKWVFNFEWTVSPFMPLMGLLVGALLCLCIGWWALRAVLNQPVMQSLRAAE